MERLFFRWKHPFPILPLDSWIYNVWHRSWACWYLLVLMGETGHWDRRGCRPDLRNNPYFPVLPENSEGCKPFGNACRCRSNRCQRYCRKEAAYKVRRSQRQHRLKRYGDWEEDVRQKGPVKRRKTETAERKNFRIWTISVVPPLAGQGAKDFIAGIINSFLLKMACRTSAGMICAVHTALSC